MPMQASFEYAFVWVGGDNARPWGAKSDGFTQSPHLNIGPPGLDLTGIVIAAGEETGTGKVLSVGTTLVANKWVGAQLRLGTTAAPLGGYADIVANGVSTVTVDWVVPAAASGTFAGYIVFPDGKWASHPQVRILTPYQPEGPDTASSTVAYPNPTTGEKLVFPGGTLPAAVTTFEDLAGFLDFTFLEGIDSHGISEATDSYTVPATHAATAVSASPATMDFANAVVANAFAGGYLRVEWITGGVPKLSWARIATNGINQFVLDSAGWLGDGVPTLFSDITKYEAWVPHWGNSPHAYLPGKGFRYPNNDMMPCSEGDGRIHNRPRRITSSSYGDRFGSMLEFGVRISDAIGKRVNIIHLGINASTLLTAFDENQEGFIGTLGWWDHIKHKDWAVANPDGLAVRLKRLIDTIAPAALTAESNTNPLRILGIVIDQGENDAALVAGRENYARNLATFITWLRDVIQDAGLNPYDTDEARVPIVLPILPDDPFITATGAVDADGLVNAAIVEAAEADGFGIAVDTNASPQITGDLEHFDGAGEAMNGELIAVGMGTVVDRALEYGSAVLEQVFDPVVDICNLALSHIGDSAAITSLDPAVDASVQAKHCARYYPKARDTLLQMRLWSFAAQRKVLTKALVTPVQWDFAYVYPAEALHVFAVLPPETADDYSQPWNPVGLDRLPTSTGNAQYVTQPYTVERAAAGHRVIYTNQEQAVARFVVRVVDANRYPELFKQALSYHLATMLAGPIVKGDEGMRVARLCAIAADSYYKQAAAKDAGQREIRPAHSVPWIAGR